MLRFFSKMMAIIAILLIPAPALSDNMQVGRQTSQPVGHYEFCKKYPAECAIEPQNQGPVVFSEVERLIVTVNADVNERVRPLNDRDIFKLDEVWAYPVQDPNSRDPRYRVGDCEDYVLEKRRRLHAAGISLANLLITVVRKPDGEGHAVLTVRTTEGDFILDNLRPKRVLSWRLTGYKYLKRQASYHTGKWVSLHGGGNNDHLTAASQ